MVNFFKTDDTSYNYCALTDYYINNQMTHSCHFPSERVYILLLLVVYSLYYILLSVVLLTMRTLFNSRRFIVLSIFGDVNHEAITLCIYCCCHVTHITVHM